MKRVIVLSAILSMSAGFMGYASKTSSKNHTSANVEQLDVNVQQILKAAGDKHKVFANQLVEVLPKGIFPYFGNAGNSKQFFADPNNENYKEIWSAGKDEKTVANAANEICKKVVKREITVKVDFPFESEPEYKGQGKKKGSHVVITTANVNIEVGKRNQPPSIAKNELILTWEVVEVKKQMQATLQSIDSKFVGGFFESEKQFMKETAERLIKRYYQNLPDNRIVIRIPNELKELFDESVKVDIVGDISNLNIPMPNALNFQVTNLPPVRIFVDPAPYMTEDRSRYIDHEAFHTVTMAFDVAFKDDLKSGSITPKVVNPVVFTQPELIPDEIRKPVVIATVVPETKPEPPKPEPIKSEPPKQELPKQEVLKQEAPKQELTKSEPPKPAPTTPASTKSGKSEEYYKVQIFSHVRNVPVSELPSKYQIKDVEVERFVMGGKTYYQYVVPVGKDMEEAKDLKKALAVKKTMIENGIKDAWIAVYENGKRIRPYGEQ